MRRPRLRTVVAAIALLLHTGILARTWFPPPQPHFENYAELEVLWVNLHESPEAAGGLSNLVELHSPDVIALGEARLVNPADLSDYRFVLRSKRRGVFLLSRHPFGFARQHQIGFGRRDLLEAELQFDGVRLRMFAAHAFIPGVRRVEEEFSAIGDYLRRAVSETDAVALIGDLNQTPWSAILHDLLNWGGVRHACAAEGLRASWHPIPRIPLGMEIDHLLAGPAVEVAEFEVLPELAGSDHRPLRARLRIQREGSPGAAQD